MGHPASTRISTQLAEKFENLNMVVLAQSKFALQIKGELASLPADLSARITSQISEGPMLEFNGEADVIMLRHVLHHFPEQAAIGLLSNLAGKLRPNGTLLIVDLVLPRPGTVSGYDEGLLRTRDLIHMELSNGETRDLES